MFLNIALTTVVLFAFALNSILCRVALTETSIDPMSFTTIRLLSGTLTLLALLYFTEKTKHHEMTPQVRVAGWYGPASLFVYAVGFSFAYVSLDAGVGALLLFGAVQITMIIYGLCKGETLSRWQWAGFLIAIIGVMALFLPGVSSPNGFGSFLMILAGIGWAVYTLLGKGVENPVRMTGTNFTKASVLSVFASALLISQLNWDSTGIFFAFIAGGITSGLGYALWYLVLRSIKVTTAAILQLSVPVITVFLGVLFLDESVSVHLVGSSFTILGGIALYITSNSKAYRRKVK